MKTRRAQLSLETRVAFIAGWEDEEAAAYAGGEHESMEKDVKEAIKLYADIMEMQQEFQEQVYALRQKLEAKRGPLSAKMEQAWKKLTDHIGRDSKVQDLMEDMAQKEAARYPSLKNELHSLLSGLGTRWMNVPEGLDRFNHQRDY